MVAHIRGEHWVPDDRFRRRHFTEAMLLRRVGVCVPERYFTPPCPDPGAEADVVEPLTCIAWRQLRERSDAVNGIWEVERLLHMLRALLDYADFPTALAPAQDDGHLPRVPDVVRWFFAAMGCASSQGQVKGVSGRPALPPVASTRAARASSPSTRASSQGQ